MNPGDLQLLILHPDRPRLSVLSVYLNVDQSQRSNQNRAFEEQLRTMMLSLRGKVHDRSELERFTEAAHHIEDFVAAYAPAGRGLAMFFDTLDGFFWQEQFDIALHNQARWERGFFLQPLANLLDQFEGYGVVLAGRGLFRLFSVLLGDIEESVREEADPIANLPRLVEEIDRLIQTRKVRGLVLAGPPEITSEVRNRLPKSLALRVIGDVGMAIDATEPEVLESTLVVAGEYEHHTERQKVKEVVRGAAENKTTVVGLDNTLNALNGDQVWELIYMEETATPGLECAGCGALFSLPTQTCSRCRGSLHRVGNVIERAVERALRKRARIEIVTGESADALSAAGGIGAFLKAKGAKIELVAS